MTSNKYFTFEHGIIKVKINSSMYDRTLSEIHIITDMLNEIMPDGCQVVLQDDKLYFYDGLDYYPIDENFDITIY
jgi:hypothetical protein